MEISKNKKVYIGVGIALLALVVLCVSLLNSGSYIAKVGNQTISEDNYKYALLIEKEKVLSNYSGMDENDVWEYKAEGKNKTYAKQLDQYVLDELVRTEVINNQFDVLGLKLTDEQNKRRKDNVQSYIKNRYKTTEKADKEFKSYYTSSKDFEKLYEDYDKYESVYLHYYDIGGEKGTTLENIDDFYQKNYALVKNIFISKEKGEEIAKGVLSECQNLENEEEFINLLNEYNEDANMSNYTNGYLISKDYTAVAGYSDKALSMNVGEVDMLQAENGYYILRKYDAKDDKVYTISQKSKVLLSMFAEDFEKMVSTWKNALEIDYNQKSLDKISIAKIQKNK